MSFEYLRNFIRRTLIENHPEELQYYNINPQRRFRNRYYEVREKSLHENSSEAYDRYLINNYLYMLSFLNPEVLVLPDSLFEEFLNYGDVRTLDEFMNLKIPNEKLNEQIQKSFTELEELFEKLTKNLKVWPPRVIVSAYMTTSNNWEVGSSSNSIEHYLGIVAYPINSSTEKGKTIKYLLFTINRLVVGNKSSIIHDRNALIEELKVVDLWNAYFKRIFNNLIDNPLEFISYRMQFDKKLNKGEQYYNADLDNYLSELYVNKDARQNDGYSCMLWALQAIRPLVDKNFPLAIVSKSSDILLMKKLMNQELRTGKLVDFSQVIKNFRERPINKDLIDYSLNPASFRKLFKEISNDKLETKDYIFYHESEKYKKMIPEQFRPTYEDEDEPIMYISKLGATMNDDWFDTYVQLIGLIRDDVLIFPSYFFEFWGNMYDEEDKIHKASKGIFFKTSPEKLAEKIQKGSKTPLNIAKKEWKRILKMFSVSVKICKKWPPTYIIGDILITTSTDPYERHAACLLGVFQEEIINEEGNKVYQYSISIIDRSVPGIISPYDPSITAKNYLIDSKSGERKFKKMETFYSHIPGSLDVTDLDQSYLYEKTIVQLLNIYFKKGLNMMLNHEYEFISARKTIIDGYNKDVIKAINEYKALTISPYLNILQRDETPRQFNSTCGIWTLFTLRWFIGELPLNAIKNYDLGLKDYNHKRRVNDPNLKSEFDTYIVEGHEGFSGIEYFAKIIEIEVENGSLLNLPEMAKKYADAESEEEEKEEEKKNNIDDDIEDVDDVEDVPISKKKEETKIIPLENNILPIETRIIKKEEIKKEPRVFPEMPIKQQFIEYHIFNQFFNNLVEQHKETQKEIIQEPFKEKEFKPLIKIPKTTSIERIDKLFDTIDKKSYNIIPMTIENFQHIVKLLKYLLPKLTPDKINSLIVKDTIHIEEKKKTKPGRKQKDVLERIKEFSKEKEIFNLNEDMTLSKKDQDIIKYRAYRKRQSKVLNQKGNEKYLEARRKYFAAKRKKNRKLDDLTAQKDFEDALAAWKIAQSTFKLSKKEPK